MKEHEDKDERFLHDNGMDSRISHETLKEVRFHNWFGLRIKPRLLVSEQYPQAHEIYLKFLRGGLFLFSREPSGNDQSSNRAGDILIMAWQSARTQDM